MDFSFIDRYSNLNSLIHRLDPRTKLVTSLLFVIVIVLTPAFDWPALLLYFCLIAALILLSKLPVVYVLKRSLVIMPFLVTAVFMVPFLKQDGAELYQLGAWQVSLGYTSLLIAANLAARAWLCILSLILLSSTTSFIDLLKGMQQLKLPQAITLTMTFMYRYLVLFVEELTRMRQARDNRAFRGGWRYGIKTAGNMIGSLFIRSYQRGERVYSALLARGYDREIRTLHSLTFKSADAYFSITFITLVGLTAFLMW